MTRVDKEIRALCLFSASLDSQLAVRLLQEQGIHVETITFATPFFDGEAARRAAGRLAVPSRVMDFTSGMARVLSAWNCDGEKPKPPCVACRTAMMQEAAAFLCDGYHFIATGEVVDQRLPSQGLPALQQIECEAGCEGFVVRPLSAGLLPETEVERRGWVDRAKLLQLRGRGRRMQMQLAETLAVDGDPASGRWCPLMEESFASRVRDLQQHEGLHGRKVLSLLRVGRHFRLGPGTKLIVGRNEHENVEIEGGAELYDLLFRLEDAPGPTGLLPFTATPDEVMLAAAICARYGDSNGSGTARIRVRSPRESRLIEVAPAGIDVVEKYRI